MANNDKEFPSIFNDKKNFKTMLKNAQTDDSSRLTELFDGQKNNFKVYNQDKNINQLESKIDRLEGLIQSIILNQVNFNKQLPNLKEEKSNSNSSKDEELSFYKKLNSKKNLMIIVLLVVTVSLLLLGLKNSQKLSSKNQFENKSPNTKPQNIQNSIKRKSILKIKKFVTTKFVNLRSSPSTKSDILTVVSPNTIIKVSKQKDGWNKIEFKDFIKEKSITGWIYGENIKLIK